LNKIIKKLRSRSIEDFWWRYRKNKAALVGLIIIVIFAFFAIFSPWLSPFDPFRLGKDIFASPNNEHLMGTDNLGRDILSRFFNGARISLLIGVLAASTSTIIGLTIGMISGYLGGIIDGILMRMTELIMVIPKMFLALIFVAVFGADIWLIIFVIGILSWPSIARITRAEFLSLKEREFVTSARAIGVSNKKIVLFEILPNASPPIIVNASLLISSAILIEAALSFLGLGDPNVVSWGQMLRFAQPFLRRAWWMMIFPGLAVSLTTLGINLVGEGLNDALNPKLTEK
jgi:peptide/nickel transport system permease protein